MADPVVTITNGVPTSGTGTITTLGAVVTALGTPMQATGGSVAITGTAAVSAASLPLPTGAATAAKQPALGTAGTPSTDVISVQGVASGTAIPVSIASLPSGAVTNAGTFAVQNTAATPAGTNVIGHVIVDTAPSTAVTNAGTFAVQVSNANANGSALSASSAPVVIASDQVAIKVLPGVTATANGATASRVNAAASTNATSLKASAGQVYTIDVFNAAAYNVFLKLYNKASAPTVGTDTPIMTIPVQAGGGYSKTWPMGLTFSTGIAYAITKLQADIDTTVLVAGDLTGNTTWI